MSEPSQTPTTSPAAPRGPGPLLVVPALLLCGLGFITISSLAGEISENLWWLVSVGTAAALVVPALLGFWLRHAGGRRRRRPRTLSMVLLCNLVWLLGAAGVAPRRTRTALEARGHWWAAGAARLFGGDDRSGVVRGTRAAISALAGLLPGAKPPSPVAAGPATASTDGGGERSPSSSPADSGASRAAADVEPPPPRRPAEPGQAERVGFKRDRGGIVVPVALRGPGGTAQVKMLFDTGASYSTVDSRTLARLGVSVTASDPTITVHTANGRVQRTITVIDAAAIGGASVAGGLTVALCDPCATGEVVGLLGLNYARHFRVTVDDSAGEITLAPKVPNPGHRSDIRPFVDVSGAKGVQRGRWFEISARVFNRSPRPIRYAKLSVTMSLSTGGKEKFVGRTFGAPARDKVTVRLRHRVAAGQVKTFRIELADASW